MSLLTPFIIGSAIEARTLSGSKNTGDEPIQKVIATAINTAIDGGLFTTTASMSGYSSQNIQNILNLLQQLGYSVSLSATTLTINW